MVPGGVWVRAFARRLTSTCWMPGRVGRGRARAPRAVTAASGAGAGRPGVAPLDSRSSPGHARVAHRVDDERRGRCSRSESGRPRRAGPGAAGPPPCPVIRCASDSIRPSACRVSGPVLPSPPGQFGVAADRGQRGPQFVAGVGDEAAGPASRSPGAPSGADPTWPSIRLRAAPTWPDLGARIGLGVRNPLDRATSPLCRGHSETRSRWRPPGAAGAGRRRPCAAPAMAAAMSPAAGDADLDEDQGGESAAHLAGGDADEDGRPWAYRRPSRGSCRGPADRHRAPRNRPRSSGASSGKALRGGQRPPVLLRVVPAGPSTETCESVTEPVVEDGTERVEGLTAHTDEAQRSVSCIPAGAGATGGQFGPLRRWERLVVPASRTCSSGTRWWSPSDDGGDDRDE